MFRTLKIAAAAALAAGLSACGPGASPQDLTLPRDLTLLWTFGGQTCERAGVANVHVVVPSEGFDQTLPCNFQGTEGARLTSFYPGAYGLTLDGLDALGAAAYSGSATVAVAEDGTNTFNVDLSPPPSGEVDFRWTFAGGLTCAAAQVANVRVTVGGSPVTLPCSAMGVDGGGLFVTPGQFNATLEALSAAGQTNYSGTLQIVSTLGAKANYTIDLAATPVASGSLQFDWTFAGRGCMDANVSKVGFVVSSIGVNNALAPVEMPAPFDCASVGAKYAALPPGRYQVQLSAYDGTGSTTYSGTFLTPVAAGVANTYAVDLQLGAGH